MISAMQKRCFLPCTYSSRLQEEANLPDWLPQRDIGLHFSQKLSWFQLFFFQPASCMLFIHSPLQPKQRALVKMNRNTWVLSRWPDVVLMQPECSVSCRSLVAEQIKQSGIPELFGHLLYRLNVVDLKNSKDLA